MTDRERVGRLEAQVRELALALSTLIHWIGTSANTPLSGLECRKLLEMLPKREDL